MSEPQKHLGTEVPPTLKAENDFPKSVISLALSHFFAPILSSLLRWFSVDTGASSIGKLPLVERTTWDLRSEDVSRTWGKSTKKSKVETLGDDH